ncbi:hypothetical protein SESBI_38146 [Sesbania bispinosa]|nr:hypothetical protein SESBI_38146 [Sesbania bispinosa]
MDNLSPTSCEEEDLRDRSTKKVKFDIDKEISMEDSNPPVHSPSTSPKGKLSYKDMVMAFEGMADTHEEMVRAVTEELFPELECSDAEESNSCFGPWMLAKKPQRRSPRPSPAVSTKDGGNSGPKSNGSRFDILHRDSGDNEDPNGDLTSSISEHHPAVNRNQIPHHQQSNVFKVRDPKGGKNNQQHKANKGKQSSIVSKQVKDKVQDNIKAKNKEVLSDIQINKDFATEVRPTVSNNLLPVRVKAIPPRTQEQKKVDHEFALQLIKKWGSPQELQSYKSLHTDSATHQEQFNSSIEPEPPDKETIPNPMAIDGNPKESSNVVADSNVNQEA